MKECAVMLKKILGSKFLCKLTQSFVALMCSALLLPGDVTPVTRFQEPAADASQQDAAPLPADQLDSLVAPIALYPDPLLAQMLAASTYPLELVQLQQWLAKNKTLKDKALVDAVEKEPWDPSVQAMAVVPDALKRLTDDIQWTTDLGNAFLAQQSDVMEAVQRMRAKAEGKGNLKSNEQMKVETKVVESKSVIVIEQANPQVVYVPSYDPVVVYGAPAYPYPPIYYPPPGYYAAGMAISFGVGMMVGAAINGGWGWGCGWGGNNNVTINNNNNFNRNSNINGGNRNNINNGNRPSNQPARGGAGGNNWQHNPQHRGGTPYGNKATANKFGGTSRGDSMSNRQANARQNQGQRGGGQQAGNMDRGGGGRQQSGASNRGAGGGGDRVGDRSTSPGSRSSKSDAFGGASRGSTGSSAKASSSRGASSMGSRGGGGGSRGGGGGRRR
jgi:Protein of unknown function (DUF3300)